MDRIVIQIRSKNPVRRRGAVSCLRSCLFNKDIHWWIVHEVKALNHLLMPLVHPTPFTEKEKEGMDVLLWMAAESPNKTVETERDILKMMLECVILLCQRRGVREVLRKGKVYYIVRNLDNSTEVEEINEAIYEIVNLLIMDEDPSVPVDTFDNQQHEAIKAMDEEHEAREAEALAREQLKALLPKPEVIEGSENKVKESVYGSKEEEERERNRQMKMVMGNEASSTSHQKEVVIEEEVHLSANEVNNLVYNSDSDEEVFDEALNDFAFKKWKKNILNTLVNKSWYDFVIDGSCLTNARRLESVFKLYI
eukprot:gene26921-33570_t